MKYALLAELRFNDKDLRDRIFEALKRHTSDMWHSRFSIHDCFHDEDPSKPCHPEEEVIV